MEKKQKDSLREELRRIREKLSKLKIHSAMSMSQIHMQLQEFDKLLVRMRKIGELFKLDTENVEDLIDETLNLQGLALA
jgi:hypothetical protein